MKYFSKFTPKLWLIVLSMVAASLGVYKVVAQTGTPAPIDFDNGPLVARNTPANVVLALSVEWPTSGGAYKDSTYIDGNEYIGYFNSQRCYTYPGYGSTPRSTATFAVDSDYFTPTGATNASYQCNLTGTGTGFSGNYLNYATMSAPDILRLALTGGDRGIDEQARTVLDRGTVYSSANYRRTVGAAVTALVTPFQNGVAVYAYNCRDEVIFTTNSSKTCASPDSADTTDLRPIVASSTPSGTTTITPTVPPIQQLGTVWLDTGAVTSTMPTLGPVSVVTFYTTTRALTTTPFSCPTSPCVTELGAVDTSIKLTTYAVSGTATTAAPVGWPNSGSLDRTVKYYATTGTSTTPPIPAAESPAVVAGYQATTGTTTTAPLIGPVTQAGYAWDNTTSTTAPISAAESPTVIRGYLWTDSGLRSLDYQGGTAPANAPSATVSLSNSRYLCYSSAAPRVIQAYAANGSNSTTNAGSSTSITKKYCTDRGWLQNISGSGAARTVYRNYTQGAAWYRDYIPTYTVYNPYYRVYAPYYTNYLRTDSYWAYTSYDKYRVYAETAVWANFSATAKAIVKPRVLVCDSTEGPTRSVVYGTSESDSYSFCKKYDFAGTIGYKPEGQVQEKSDTLRLAVMSYLLDTGTRNGGVLRAPMKYVGPNKYDANGSLMTNDEREWSVTTGQFVTKPITDSVSTSYTYTGVINYLNRFGKTGNYKELDPVGELWYESLRYLQGLQPSSDATTGMTETMKDGYPVYSSWTDPLTSSCQRRNFILGIGDTNTHYDRTVPGVTRAQQTTLFNESPNVYDATYSTTPTINGSAAALDAHTWTRRVDAFERSGASTINYTDVLGRSQDTTGNPAANASLPTLDTSATGSSNHASYHWAGLAYWANTQPVRLDTKGGSSMDKVRVKTFMIDVDENNQNSINAAIQKTSFYLAGKYGYFDDTAQTGKPFNGTDNSLWAEADGAPKGHVLASQPKRLVAGIKKFFDDSGKGGGSFATVAVSSNSFSANSPDGKTYEPSFVPGQWSGTIQSKSLTLNTTTQSLSSGSVTWDAGEILTSASRETGVVTSPLVKPVDRTIVTYIGGTVPKAVTFTYADLGTDLPATFNTVPYTSVVDNLGELRVNYLRGDRAKELDLTFRPRVSIMGDIINSGPVYKQGANPELGGVGYDAYFAGKKSRTAVVYAGANDGMLHAFNAQNGQELFAYIPGAVLAKTPNLASKSYIHTAFVDALPVVDEVKTSAGWKTILVSGMGGGAQGIFALDVSSPLEFNKDKVMFEFTDLDDAHMGNVTAPPKLVKMLQPGSSPAAYKYYIAVSSGYNNYKNDGTGRFVSTPEQAIFFLDVNKAIESPWALGSNYFKVLLPASDPTVTNGLAQPGVRLGSAGEAIEFFAGDLQGNIWKLAFPDGINTEKADLAIRVNNSSVKTPVFTAKIGTVAQPITSSPVIYPYLTGGSMVIFGTGKLMESTDRNTTVTHSIYGVWDSGQSNASSYSLTRSDLRLDSVNTTTLVISGTTTATFSSASGAKRGWYFDLPRAKERVLIDAVAATGVVNINSTIPPTSECSDNGDGLKYFLRPSTGLAAAPTEGEGGGYLGKSTVVEIDTSTSTASSYSPRTNAGRRTATKRDAILTQRQSGTGSTNTTMNFDVTYLSTGRIYWREVRDFNQANP